MANHPFGLRGDPFASPATLSAKDASRLIRRRVRAFNGDGGALFPIDTCDLIHELEGGLPDPMLALAGRALRVAAEAGAGSVTPEHVRQAFGAQAEAACAAEVVAPPAERAAPAPSDARSTAAPAREAAAANAGPRPHTPTAGEPPDTADTAGGWIESVADHGPDDDVPPLPAGGFALPSRPSESLDRDEREWVSRFISASTQAPTPLRFEPAESDPAPRPRRQASRSRPAPAISAPAPAPAHPTLSEELPAMVSAAPRPRRGPRSRGHGRRRRSSGRGLVVAFAVLCIVAFVARQSLRGMLAPPADPARRAEPAAVRPVETPAPAPEREPVPSAVLPPELAPVGEPAAPAVVEDEPTLGSARRAEPDAPARSAPPTPPPPAPKDEARPAAPSGRFALEVATFIFEERARVERDRLARAGLRARLTRSVEYGSRVYRVVVGGYANPAAAERAADSLLANGVVLQARVIATGR